MSKIKRRAFVTTLTVNKPAMKKLTEEGSERCSDNEYKMSMRDSTPLLIFTKKVFWASLEARLQETTNQQHVRVRVRDFLKRV